MTDLRGHLWSDLLTGLNAGQHLTVDAVVAFVDGELGVSARERAAAHLTSCPSCFAEVAAQRQARSAVRSAAEPAVPSSLLAMLRSIPQTAEYAGAPDGLAVTSDGTLVSVSPNTPAHLGSAAHLSAHAGNAAFSRTGTARQGAGTVLSGLVLGALIMVTPGGAPVPTEPAPRAPAPVIPVVDGAVPAVHASSSQLELHGVGVSDQAATGRSRSAYLPVP
ncbi:MAG TPA: zf-HC2 domain-containing protein [Pseudonocardiaceae bacterium]|jgi:anti-sigma factor RsiW|nr:zf-HC2 domain-containing protein [Pseudonocardiaceae bacterium]